MSELDREDQHADSAAGRRRDAHDRHYYETGCGPIPYDRRHPHWLEFFGRVADRVVAEIRPRTVLDVGCAKGFLVEALRDRGVKAFGIDISEYGISEVRPDIQPYCRVASALDPFDEPYDLICCIEVLEHMPEEEGKQAIVNICGSTEDVLFSSTPDDFEAATHANVRPAAYWIEQFAAHGFDRDADFDAGFIALHAVRFRLSERGRLRRRVEEQERRREEQEKVIAELSFHLLALQQTIGWKVLERLRRVRDYLLPIGSQRRRAYRAFRRVVEVLLDQGLRAVIQKTTLRIRRRWRGQARPVEGPPEDVAANLNAQYRLWLLRHELSSKDLAKMKVAVETLGSAPLVSILTPVRDPDEACLRKAIESVQAQTYVRWELCLVNDGSTKPYVRQTLDYYAALDARICVKHLAEPEGIAAASNHALSLATGDFVGLLDHDDELSPDALFAVAKRLNEDPGMDLVYSDEDKLEVDGSRVDPFFKPAWSPDLLLSMNYIAHFSVLRRSLVEEVGGFRRGFEGSQDYDLFLRVTERTAKIAHIPKILYHWRKSPGSAAGNPAAKPWAYEAGQRAIEDALRRRGVDGSVERSPAARYTVKYGLRGTPLVSIVIPTRDRCHLLRQCIQNIEDRTEYASYELIIVDNESTERETLEYLDAVARKWRVVRCPWPFNFGRINNNGAAHAKGEYLVFLNNDTQVIRPDWLQAMLEQAQRPEVGAVGARLLYPDGRIQHAGVVLGIGGVAGHAFKHLPRGGQSYFDLADVVRNCTAVTAASMMVPRRVFEEIGGFDERFRVAFNDVDLCLRIGQRGYRVIYTPFALLYHHESATRGRLHPADDEALMWKVWGGVIKAGDPYYNPNLTLTREDWSLRL